MSTFVDTSAFMALLIAEDINNAPAAVIWKKLDAEGEQLVTSNYIVVETCALFQRRSGLPTVRGFLEDVLPLVLVEWVDLPLHSTGSEAVLTSSRSGPNIVDCVSFAVMRKLGIKKAFTFDRHFSDQGFETLTDD
jgi:predicted nucleic acid-binding protein